MTKLNEIFPAVLYALKSQAIKFIVILNKQKAPKSWFENLEHTLCPSFKLFKESASDNYLLTLGLSALFFSHGVAVCVHAIRQLNSNGERKMFAKHREN